MNIGQFQILFWPRRALFFRHPSRIERKLGLYRHIYHWIVYLWPIEIRRFRRKVT